MIIRPLITKSNYLVNLELWTNILYIHEESSPNQGVPAAVSQLHGGLERQAVLQLLNYPIQRPAVVSIGGSYRSAEGQLALIRGQCVTFHLKNIKLITGSTLLIISQVEIKNSQLLTAAESTSEMLQCADIAM